MILPHLSCSALRKLASACGGPPKGSAPSSANRVTVAGCAMSAFTYAFRRRTMSAGVPAGA